PQDTVTARVRDVTVLGRIMSEAWQAGALRPAEEEAPPELEQEVVNFRPLMPGVPDNVIWRVITGWTGLYGWVSFEVFGQFNNTIEDRGAAFGHTMRLAAGTIGLTR
ncbi:TetR-like C-terminal domain-containing protein, partial [Nonomuraea sp. NPDC004297]